MKDTQNRDVLVVGGGIAGMQSALVLAEMGYRVTIVDKAPAIGGYFPLLDRQFPTNSCGVCFMKPTPPAYCPIYESQLHENIDIVTNADVESLEGEPGSFRACLIERPRFVDASKCTHCDRCVEVCPVEVPSELGGGLESRKAIYIPFAQAIPRSYVVDPEACTRCGECVKVCEAGAIDLDEKPSRTDLEVGSVILGLGFEPFNAELKGEYGFGRYANVITSIQYERMLSSSSPSSGFPVRLSDGKRPQKIAFIQCVGSRDLSCDQPHCSTICCMYATKQAMVSKDRIPGLEITVFYMDIRPIGKDYERYYERARGPYGIRYQRSAVSAIRELQQSKNLVIAHGGEDGTITEDIFDMVVLSVGFTPPAGAKELADRLGVALNDGGFCRTEEFTPTATSRPGVFVAGGFKAPKDIPDAVVEGSSAAADVACLLNGLNREKREIPQYPAVGERETLAPNIGVFLMNSGDGLGDVLSLKEIAEAMRKEKYVVHVEEVSSPSLRDGLGEIMRRMGEKEINRVVVAGASEMDLRNAGERMAREAGFSPDVFAYTNVGEQCAYVHSNDPGLATEKAKVLIRSNVARARRLNPVERGGKQVVDKVLVVGGGVTGLAVSLSLAEQGLGVTLIEKEEHLGGNARHAFYTLKQSDPQALVKNLIERVEDHPAIEVWKKAEIESSVGDWGDFRTSVVVEGEKRDVVHGALVLATGGREMTPKEYGYGEDPRIVTQRELERMIAKGDDRVEGLKSVAMIQCVGSRDDEHPYCSRVCCGHAIKNALKLKEKEPNLSVGVFYRDVRTYGFFEEYYQAARDQGVLFIRYEPEDKPKVQVEPEGIRIAFTDTIVGHRLEFEADLLVLSTGIEANDNRDLAETMGIEMNADGFFQEVNPKSAPLDAVDRGKFICGLCHSPNHIEDCLSQANAVAGRAAALLGRKRVEYKPYLAYVIERLCCGCGLCVTTCPYGARVLDEETGKARVHEDLCQGCGNCVIACPNGASQQLNYEKATVLATLDAVID
jgi:heterodisulfide reductase subunit A